MNEESLQSINQENYDNEGSNQVNVECGAVVCDFEILCNEPAQEKIGCIFFVKVTGMDGEIWNCEIVEMISSRSCSIEYPSQFRRLTNVTESSLQPRGVAL